MSSNSQIANKALVSSVFFMALLAPGVRAENGAQVQRGRLPDGRAFRLDQQSGLRLSDYVAELEVSNDDLKRQMVALEDELNERRQQIEQYEKETGKKLTPKIKEATLVDKSLPPAKSAPISCSPGDPAMVALTTRIKELETQSKSPNSQSQTPPPQVVQCDYNSSANPYLEQVASLKRALQESPSKDALEKSREQLQGTQAQLVAANKMVSERDEEISRLSSMVSRAQTEIAQLQSKKIEPVLTAKIEPPTAVAPSAPEPRARQISAPVQKAPVAESVPEPSELPAVANDKAELSTTLTRIQTLVLQRKTLLDSVKSTGKGIVVSIQPLITKGRITLDDSRMNVQRFQNGQDATGIRNSLNEIEAILNDDIKVLQRLAH